MSILGLTALLGGLKGMPKQTRAKVLACIVLVASVSLAIPFCSIQTANSLAVGSVEILQATTTVRSVTIVTVTLTRSYTRTMNYSGGYYDGYYDGYKQGYSEAYANGHRDGYSVGYKDGFNAGYNYTGAFNEGYGSGYKNGYREGYGAGSNSSQPEVATLQAQNGQLVLVSWVLGIAAGVLAIVALGLYFRRKENISLPDLVAKSRK